jgi:NAD(P)-dependent dehydrogenase (short-subunit alcohol dehydrogenase family)
MSAQIALSSRSVAITGAGTGLGRELALGFAAKG